MSFPPLPTVTAGGAISASAWGNVVRDYLAYLLNRPGQSIVRDNNANYTNAVVGWADIDSTNLKITLANKGSLVWLWCAAMISGTSGTLIDFDFTVNGTRIGAAGADGLSGWKAPASALPIPVNFGALAVVSPGSNVFRPQWSPQSASAWTMYAGAGSAGTDWLVQFGAVEVA